MRKISSRENRHIKDCLKLKQKKYRDARHLFLIEGHKILHEAMVSKKVNIRQIFVSENILHQLDLKEFDSEIFVVNSRLMTEISDTTTPQGILAIIEKPVWNLEEVTRNNSTFILLDSMADPGNMGTIIRTALAFEAGGILLTPGCVDPFSPKVVRSTMGAIFDLPIFENITLDNLNNLKKDGFKLVGSALDNAVDYYEYDFNTPSIIVIGNEAHGINAELIAECNNLVTIPINPDIDSLNAGVACGIILSEVWKQKNI